MKILKIIYEFYPNQPGGAEISALEIARRLVQQGHQVTVLTARKNGLKSHETHEGIVIHRVWMAPSMLLSQICFLMLAVIRAWVLHRNHSFDIMHCYLILPAGMIGSFVAPITGIPFVLTIQGADVSKYERIRFLHQLVKRALKKANIITVLSTFLQRQAEEQGVPAEKIRVIPNGIDVRQFRTDGKTNINTRNEITPVQFIAVCTLRRVKRVDILIQSFHRATHASMRSMKLVIVGDGPEREHLMALCEALEIEANVEFTGALPYSQVAARMKTADVFVLSSEFEGMANVVVEAIACGLPVITTDCGGPADFITHCVNGLVVPVSDIPAMADAIRCMAEDDALRQTLTAYSQTQFQHDTYDWSNIANRYVTVYEQIMEQK